MQVVGITRGKLSEHKRVDEVHVGRTQIWCQQLRVPGYKQWMEKWLTPGNRTLATVLMTQVRISASEPGSSCFCTPGKPWFNSLHLILRFQVGFRSTWLLHERSDSSVVDISADYCGTSLSIVNGQQTGSWLLRERGVPFSRDAELTDQYWTY